MEIVKGKTARQIGLRRGMEIAEDSPGVIKSTVTRVARNWRWADICWQFEDGSKYGYRHPLMWRGKVARFAA
jgi:hypothetical protein